MNKDDMILISVDDHIVEPPDMFKNHLPKKYLDEAPRLVHNPDGSDTWQFRDVVIPNVALNAVAGRPKEEYGLEPQGLDEIRPGCWQVDERVKDMNAGGILGSMCFPSFPGFAGRLFATEDPEFSLALLQAYNDWHVEEWCGAYPARFIPMTPKCRRPSRRAKGRSSSSTPRRACRPRPSPTPTPPSRSGWRSSPSSTRSTSPAPTRSRVAEEIEQVLGFPAEDAILVSAKTGQGIDELISQLCDQLPPPTRQARPPAPRPDLRQHLRRLPRRHRLRPRHRRRARQGPEDPLHGHRQALPGHRPRQAHAAAQAGRRDRHRRGRFHRRRHQGPARRPHRRHRHRRRQPRRRSRCPATSRSSRWSTATSTPAARRSTTSCATRWTACSSTTASFTFEPEIQRRPGLRLPLRLPRPAAHGDHPGAAGARVQHRGRSRPRRRSPTKS